MSAESSLRQLYRVALDAIDARDGTRRALEREPSERPVVLLAVGKASCAMAQGALDALGTQLVRGAVHTRQGQGRPIGSLAVREAGHPLPDARSVTYGCSCDLQEEPCRHVLALHELFARRLDEKPWELLMLRGVDLHDTLTKVNQTEPDADLPPLAYGVPEEPVLYPDAEDADLDQSLGTPALRWLVGDVSPRAVDASLQALAALSSEPPAPPETAPDGDDGGDPAQA